MSNIRKFGSKNMTEMTVGTKKVLFSYKTPVVIFDGENHFVTSERFSTTTTRQINFYLREVQASEVSTLSPDLFQKLGKKLGLIS
jgi:hypothetical protein